jgi:hypothetical protein
MDMPNKKLLIFAGLTQTDVFFIMGKYPHLFLWDSYRGRVKDLEGLEEKEMVMAIYQLMFEQEYRAKWTIGVLSFSWVDAALFLDDRHPSYVENFSKTFQDRFSHYTHCGFYENEFDCLRLNRVLPGIKILPKQDLDSAVRRMIAS